MSQGSLVKSGEYLDKTFSAYDAEQAVAYSEHRRDPYTERIYSIVLEYHQNTGGELRCLLDVGCGTGEVTRSLARHFDRATGVDPSKEMIARASKIGGNSKSGIPIQFEVGRAEDLDSLQSIKRGEVDLLVAGMAVSFLFTFHLLMADANFKAHWFKMDQFWTTATEVVKPGGTVALWTSSSLFCRKLYFRSS
jgi:trans-aconitate 3-methyltransferase